MSSKKSKKTNPYIYYCLEKQQICPELKGKSLPELVAICGSEWSSMGPDARRPYIESARDLNAGRIEPTFCSSKSIADSPVSDLGHEPHVQPALVTINIRARALVTKFHRQATQNIYCISHTS